MMDKMKAKKFPNDYRVYLYKKLQGLKQKYMDVKRYTKEFHKLDIRVSRDEDIRVGARSWCARKW